MKNEKASDNIIRLFLETVRFYSSPWLPYRKVAESVYEFLRLFDKLYDKMNDHEKKSFVNSFIDSIELYPNKGRKNGCVIKMIHFKFPVSYDGKEVYDVLPPLESSDETGALLGKQNLL